MGEVHGLSGLAFPAVEGAVIGPFPLVADGIAGVPELGGDPEVGGFFHDARDLAVFDLPPDLGGELEVVAVVIDGPGLGVIHKIAVFGVFDEVLQCPGISRQE